MILQAWGRLEEAMALHKKQEAACEELGDRAGLQRSWGNQAGIAYIQGELEEAMVLYQKQESTCKKLGDRASEARARWGQGLVLERQGREIEGREMWKRAEAVFGELGMVRERDLVRELLGGSPGGAGED